jgi:serine/threonine protein phosphatase PrpC
MPAYRVASRTDFGRVRSHNEDFHIVEAPGAERPYGVFILCDGMGGSASGEVASEIAATSIREHIHRHHGSSAGTGELLDRAVQEAQQKLASHQGAHPETVGMGCTAMVAILDGTRLAVAHVGDCRCYVSTDDAIRSLTLDHSWAAELYRAGALASEDAVRNHHQRHILTRYLGGREPGRIEVDLVQHDVAVGDRVLLCTDGLWDMVTDAEIQRIVRSSAPETAAIELVDAANREGGRDNVTVILFERTE